MKKLNLNKLKKTLEEGKSEIDNTIVAFNKGDITIQGTGVAIQAALGMIYVKLPKQIQGKWTGIPKHMEAMQILLATLKEQE